jgi:hypothetical protein
MFQTFEAKSNSIFSKSLNISHKFHGKVFAIFILEKTIKKMKQLLVLILSVVLLSSCGVFGPNPEYYQGMTEKKFLRQNEFPIHQYLQQ